MNKVSLISRYLLALMMAVFGLNKFLQFLPMEAPPSAGPYWMGLSSVHLIEILGVIYLASAVLLALNKMVGLVTVILAAVAFNAVLYHVVLDTANIAGALVFSVLIILTMLGDKKRYQALLSS